MSRRRISIARVARAVGFAHDAGIVHRDLKPGNILLAKDGTPKVGDFGLAFYENGEQVHDGEVAGTPAYMAPEQVSGTRRQIDRRADIWALGVILYQLLCGKMPFEGSRDELFDQIANGEPESLQSIAPTIPPDLEAVCRRCLAKAPADRFPSALDLALELERICASYDETRVLAPRAFVHDERPVASSRRKIVLGSAVCLLLLGGWLGRSLWSGPGAVSLKTTPDVDAFAVAEKAPDSPKSDAQILLDRDRSAVLKPRDPRWTSLLNHSVTPILWREQDARDSWACDETTGRLAVRSEATGIFTAGKGGGETISLHTTLKAQKWDGIVGVIWGLHERADRTKPFRFAWIRGEIGNDPARVQIGECEVSHTPLGWLVTRRYVWFSQPITTQLIDRDVDLQVDVKDGSLDQVLVDHVTVVEAAQLKHLALSKATVSNRGIGLAAEGMTILIKSYDIRE